MLLLGASVGSCRLAKATVEAPGKLASAAMGNEKDERPPLDPWAMSQWLMGFADTASAEIENATREFARTADTDEARMKALEWRIEYTTLAIQLATAPQPYDSFFRVLLALAVQHANHDTRLLAEWGEASQPIGDAVGRLEGIAWGKAEEILDKDQLTKVRRVIDHWLEANPDASPTALPQLDEVFAGEAGGEEEQGFMGGVTGLLTIDPLAGLEPAARQVELSRQFAERSLPPAAHAALAAVAGRSS